MKFVLFKFINNRNILAFNPLTICNIAKSNVANTQCIILDINNNSTYVEGSLEENLQKINDALGNYPFTNNP